MNEWARFAIINKPSLAPLPGRRIAADVLGGAGVGEVGGKRSRIRAPRFFAGGRGGNGKALSEYRSSRENIGREIMSRIDVDEGAAGKLLMEGYRRHCIVASRSGGGWGESWSTWAKLFRDGRRGLGGRQEEKILCMSGKRLMLVSRLEGNGDCKIIWEVKLASIVESELEGKFLRIWHLDNQSHSEKSADDDESDWGGIMLDSGLSIMNRGLRIVVKEVEVDISDVGTEDFYGDLAAMHSNVIV